MFVRYLLLSCILFPAIAVAQSWTIQNGETTKELSGVAFADVNNGWAVGIQGTILHTTNGGAKWAAQISGTREWLIGVTSVNALNAWAVGESGIILRTSDGGDSWSVQKSGTRAALNNVTFVDANFGWAGGSDGTIIHTSNGGTSWEAQKTHTSCGSYCVAFVDKENGWAVGCDGTILSTTNGGNNWGLQTSPSGNLLIDVSFIDARHGWVVGSGGTILRTPNGGGLWMVQSGGTNYKLSDAALVDEQSGWIVGEHGTILYTSNGGVDWLSRSSGVNLDLHGAAFVDANNGWAVGDHGTILHYGTPKVLEPAERTPPREKFPPILLSRVTFSEPSGNNMLDGGESATLKLTVSNSGKGAAYNLRAQLTLSGNTRGITAENLQTVGKIAPSKEAVMEFRISADRSVITDTVHCNVTFTEGNGSEPAPVSLTVGTQAFQAPKLAFVEAGINDGNSPNSSGNGNHIIENLETIETTCLIQNQGQGEAKNVEAHIRIGDANIVCSGDSVFDLGVMKPGDSKTFAFSFWVNNRYNGAAQLPISLELSESYGQYGGTYPLGLEMHKVSRTPEQITVPGTPTPPVSIPNPPSLVSDVDKDIPNGRPNPDAVAVVIGVEHYRNVAEVTFAQNDAQSFRDYAVKVLGVPDDKNHLYFRTDDQVTKGELEKIFGEDGWLARHSDTSADVYVYYAGHGAPDIQEKAPYLIPCDGDPNYPKLTGFSVSGMYEQLSRLKAHSITVFMDACFSGVSRDNQPLLADSRPFRLVVNNPALSADNMSVIAACGSDQISSAYPEQKHGLFTYFLLKALRGDADANKDTAISLSELEQYLTSNVRRQAGLMDRQQTPQVFALDKSRILVRLK